MNPYIIDSDSLNMNPQVDSFDSRGKRSIQGSKCSNSSPTQHSYSLLPSLSPQITNKSIGNFMTSTSKPTEGQGFRILGSSELLRFTVRCHGVEDPENLPEDFIQT